VLSVVIPTRDRADTLAETLVVLAGQRGEGLSWEVVVVDNGSTDETHERVQALAASFPVTLRVVHEPRPGPAAARNTGVREAVGEVILFLGDDMAPADAGILAGHAAQHAARPDENYAVLGRATWRPDRPVSAFMRWLENGGPQFQYFRLAPGPVPASTYFYTPHVSLKAALLERVGGFTESFPFAATEDMELGVRLEQAGMVLDYHPELLVFHDHPTTIADSLLRMEKVGRSGRHFQALHPGRTHGGAPVPGGLIWALAERLPWLWAVLSRSRVPTPLRERAWTAQHMASYVRGWRAGL
jgi:glycosyltransferase involved in cell wall biosynthesis